MNLILNKNKNQLDLSSDYIKNINSEINKLDTGKMKKINFNQLRLFFCDKSITKYDTNSDGFIHQFLLEQGYEVEDD